jgi:mRNA interferase RelE/StbE
MSDSFTLRFTEKAFENLKRLDKSVAERILIKLEWLATNAAIMAHAPLTGQWSGFYRLRVGDYRVIYQMDRENLVIVVEVIGHRSKIYDE